MIKKTLSLSNYAKDKIVKVSIFRSYYDRKMIGKGKDQFLSQ